MRSWQVESLLAHAEEYGWPFIAIEGGGQYVDCGIEAGEACSRASSWRGSVWRSGAGPIVPGELGEQPIPLVQVVTDHPVHACLASQYAGWALKEGKFFAMGSGPMRAAAGSEAIFDVIGFRETADASSACSRRASRRRRRSSAKIAQACRVDPAAVTLLAAPTASLAGGLQIVARSVETALHKLAELKFDLSRIVSAHGTAPLPPVAANDLAAIGRTNDAILYGRGWSSPSPATTRASKRSAPRCRRRPRATTASRLRRSSPGTTTISTPSTLTCSAQPRSPSRTSRPGTAHTFGQVTPGILARSFGI